MTKTSEFSWKQDEAKALMVKFENFWTQNPTQYGITGGTDAATGTPNARNLFTTMTNHGVTSRKENFFEGAGDVWDDLSDIVKDAIILDDELEEFDRMLGVLEKIEGTDKDPRNILFNTVVEYNDGQTTRGEVRGHFLTLPYWNFRKDKAEDTNTAYNVDKPKEEWVALNAEENTAEPPLWRIIFGRKNSLRSLIMDIKKLAQDIEPPPVAHLEVNISSGKFQELATIPQVQQAVKNVLQETSIYQKGRLSRPVKERLNAAMASQVIPATDAVMRIVAPQATVKVNNNGRIIRRKLVEFPGYEETQSLTLKFPSNNKTLNRLIRTVLGDDMESFLKPNADENAKAGLILTSDEVGLINDATRILKEIGYSLEPNNIDALGVTSPELDSETPKTTINLNRILQASIESIRNRAFNNLPVPDDILDEVNLEQVVSTLKHELTHYAQFSTPEIKEHLEQLANSYVYLASRLLEDNLPAAEYSQLLIFILKKEIYNYIFLELPAYWIEGDLEWEEALELLKRTWISDNPFMKKISIIYEVISPDFLNRYGDRLERETILAINTIIDEMLERGERNG